MSARYPRLRASRFWTVPSPRWSRGPFDGPGLAAWKLAVCLSLHLQGTYPVPAAQKRTGRPRITGLEYDAELGVWVAHSQPVPTVPRKVGRLFMANALGLLSAHIPN